MRAYIKADGTDTTLAVQAYLLAASEILTADCIEIVNMVGWTLRFTSFGGPVTLYRPNSSPLTYDVYLPRAYRRGSLKTVIGFEVGTFALEITFADEENVAFPAYTPATSESYALRQSFMDGFWDSAAVTVYRTVMPTPGDTATYGSCVMFFGHIGKIEAGKVLVKLEVNAGIEILNRQLPPWTVESDNRLAELFPGINPYLDVAKHYTATVQSGTDKQTLLLTPYGDYSTGLPDVAGGSVYFNPALSDPGPLAGLYWPIANNASTSVHLLKRLPITPPNGTTVEILAPVPKDRATAATISNGGVTYNSFDRVPQPEMAAASG